MNTAKKNFFKHFLSNMIDKIEDFIYIPPSTLHYASTVKIWTIFYKHEVCILYTNQIQHCEKVQRSVSYS